MILHFKTPIAIVFSLITILYSCKNETELDVETPSIVKGIYIKNRPQTVFLEGDTLLLTNLLIELSMDDGTSEVIEPNDFEKNGLVCVPSVGCKLTTLTNLITITHSETTKSVSLNITVHSNTVIDIDGNKYGVIRIGSQFWMSENLKVTHYPNGDLIPMVSDLNNDGSSADEFRKLNYGDPAYCSYNDDSNNQYGLLYTWTAAMGGTNVGSKSDTRGIKGICPVGWHIPSIGEFNSMRNYIINSKNGLFKVAYLLKSKNGWPENENGSDFFGFSALPGGSRNEYGNFVDQGVRGNWWTCNEISADNDGVYSFFIKNGGNELDYSAMVHHNKNRSYSIRCIKD